MAVINVSSIRCKTLSALNFRPHADAPGPCGRPRTRPRLEGHDHYVYGVFLVPICIREEDRVFYQEVDMIATRERLVTVRKTPERGFPVDVAAAQEAVANE